jgi:hypothetical protein
VPGSATTIPGAPGTGSGGGGPGGGGTGGGSGGGGAPQTAPRVTTVLDRALAIAQDMADALADGDWRAVRRLSPTDRRTDAQLATDYAGLDSSTVVPASEAQLSSGLVDLRVGLVAHETRPAGPQTSLFCAHWIVDPANSTVQRLDAAHLRTEGGTIAPAEVEAELADTCATIQLR